MHHGVGDNLSLVCVLCCLAHRLAHPLGVLLTDFSYNYLRYPFMLEDRPTIGLAKAFEGVSLKGCPIEKVQKLWLCGTSVTSLEILDTPKELQWTMKKG